MNDKDFVFDFYIGDDNGEAEEKTESIVEDNDAAYIEESEILLNSFAEEESAPQEKKKNIFSRLAIWWKNRKKWQKATIIASIALILVFSIIFGIFYSGFGYNYNKITNDYEDLGIENVIDKDIINVALFGIDTRNTKSFKGNSDSIMVLSLNTNTKKVKIISLMRDTFVPITYNGITTYNKINSAYAKGGPELAIKVINSNFGLDITEYATVNFFGMVDIIDAVGGIEAELTPAEVVSASKNAYALNGCITEICTGLGVSAKENYVTAAGKQHLNGIQAVAYSRIRYVSNIWGTNNDYGRTDRQRYVMEQLFNKALTIEKSQYMKLAKSLIPCTETSLSYTEILGLAFDMLLDSPTFEQARIPRDDMLMSQPKTSAGSVVYYDLGFAKKLIHAFIYDDITFDEYVEDNGVEKNDWYGGATSNRRPSSNTSSGSNNSGTVSKPSNNKNNDATSGSSGDNGPSNNTGSSGDETTSGIASDSGEDNTSTENTNGDDKDNTSSGAEDTSSSDNSSGTDGDDGSNGASNSNGDDTNSSDENSKAPEQSGSTDTNQSGNNSSTGSNASGNTSTDSNPSTSTESSGNSSTTTSTNSSGTGNT